MKPGRRKRNKKPAPHTRGGHDLSYIRYCHEKWIAATLAAEAEGRSGTPGEGGPVMRDWMREHLPGLFNNLDGSSPFRAYMIGLLDGYSEVQAILETDPKDPRLPKNKR